MYEKPIEKMDFKELREVVQHIADSLEKYKRIMNDTVSNIDSDNFSKQFLVEYGKMQSQITMTAKSIKSMVSDTDLLTELERYSTIVQTAEQIELAVVRANSATDDKLKEYSTITQTADAIKTVVAQETAGFVDDTDLAEELKKYSTIVQTAEQIELAVVRINGTTDEKLKEYSTITQTADAIKTVVAEETAGFITDTDLDAELKKYSTIEQTATDISAAVTSERAYITSMLENDYYTQEEVNSKITVSADGVLLDVSKIYKTITASDSDIAELGERIDSTDADVVSLQSSIDINADKIAAIVSGQYTDELLKDYFTGIVISPNSIKMQDGNMYSEYSSEGLKFYDSESQLEGWSIEPNSIVGGNLNYYINNKNCYRFGRCQDGTTGHGVTDMVLMALNDSVARFVVDVTNSSYPEVKFVGMNDISSNGDEPRIFANEQLLATQDWVLANAGSGGGTTTVVFG